MVHPYLRRRQGLESVQYPHPSLEPVLAETLGVILFQEQVLRVAMVVADFSGGEADRLRRAMSRSRSQEEMTQLGQLFITRAMHKGLSAEEALAIFAQLEGFASYGFCKSHAAAFALLAYQTMWLKHYYPAAFYCALLDHQPMGFYSPGVVVGDAQRHSVTVLPPDLNRSQDACTLEGAGCASGSALYQGSGSCRPPAFIGGADLALPGLGGPLPPYSPPHPVVEALIRAGALDNLAPLQPSIPNPKSAIPNHDSLDTDRRQLLWQLGALDYRPQAFDLDADLEPVDLPGLPEVEAMAWQQELLGMTPGDHLMRLYRPRLQAAGVLSAADLERCGDGEVVRIAGQVVVRQSPSTAKGHLFITLEDETGLSNLIVRPRLYAKRFDVLRYAPLLVVTGRVQREGEVCSVLVFAVEGLGGE